MATSSNGHLKKDITLFGAFAIALGTTVSSGFFLLPGMVFKEAGPAILVAYLVAGLVIIPPLLCKSELATAMPRAGGVYFYLDRSLGPMAGTVTGIGTWISLTLKTSFALVGTSFYIKIFMADAPGLLIAIGIAIAFMVLNILGTAKTSLAQSALVVGILLLLTWFMIDGLPEIQYAHFEDFMGKGTIPVVSLIGVVMISYMGISKIASVAEEIRNPERNIPMGIFLALATAIIIYMLGLTVMIGVIPAAELASTDTPAADAAQIFAGSTGQVLISIAAIASFLSVANAGILSASRYPLAMARDHLAPISLRRIGKFNTPTNAIILTLMLIILELCLMYGDPITIAKLAGTIMMVLFALLCLAVIVMRESRIHSYDPGFRTPLYPWIPLLGFALCISVIGFLGWGAAVFAIGLIIVGITWFLLYARKRVRRYGAIYHVFSRLGENRFDPLDVELREIIKEKGLRKADPFDEIVAIAPVINLDSVDNFGTLARNAAVQLSKDGMLDADQLTDGFLQGTRIGATPVSGNAALPHMRIEGLASPRLAIARIRNGLEISLGSAIGDQEKTATVQAVFFLVSPQADPAQHLRLLAKIAGCVEESQFETHWMEAEDSSAIREVLLRDDRYLSFVLQRNTPREPWIGREIRDLKLPEGCLVALVERGDETIVPRGSTVLDHGDALILIGEPSGIQAVREQLELAPQRDNKPLDDV